MADSRVDDRDGVATDATPNFCPASLVLDLVAHKWTVTILHRLHVAGAPVRFRQLQKLVKPITQKELTKRLRELERSGLVDRTIYPEVPPRVEYRLTDLGGTLIPLLAGLHEWSERYAEVVHENRRKADDPGLAG